MAQQRAGSPVASVWGRPAFHSTLAHFGLNHFGDCLMSVPFHSVQSGPGVNQRSFVDQVTGTAYPYTKGSSTDGVDEKAVAFAALTAGQTSRITTLRNGGVRSESSTI